MPKFTKLYIHLNCLYCDEVRTTARSLYWHLRQEHNIEHDAAYYSVGESIQKSITDWNLDKYNPAVSASLTDRTCNRHRWKGFYEKGTDSQKKTFFSKQKIQF